jgi:hypothetical protein
VNTFWSGSHVRGSIVLTGENHPDCRRARPLRLQFWLELIFTKEGKMVCSIWLPVKDVSDYPSDLSFDIGCWA